MNFTFTNDPWNAVDPTVYDEIVFEIENVGVVTVPILKDENRRLREQIKDPRVFRAILEDMWRKWEAGKMDRMNAYRKKHPYNPADDIFGRTFPDSSAGSSMQHEVQYDDDDDIEIIETQATPISTPRGIKRSSKGTVVSSEIEIHYSESVETQESSPITPGGVNQSSKRPASANLDTCGPVFEDNEFAGTQDSSSNSAKRPTAAFNWSEDAIQCMLSIRLSSDDKFLKSSTKQSSLWRDVAKQMKEFNTEYNLTGSMASEKFRNLLKTYRENKVRQGKTGEGVECIRWPYFQQFDSVFGKRAKIVVPVENIAGTINVTEQHQLEQVEDNKQQENTEQEDEKLPKMSKRGMSLPAYRKAKIGLASAKLKMIDEHNKEKRKLEQERTEAFKASEKLKLDLMKTFLEKNQN